MTNNMQLVFRGEVLDGFQAEEVKRRLAQALKLDEARVAQLFSGSRTVLKRSVEPALARSYAQKLAQLGAHVHLEPSDAPPTTGFAPLPELPDVPASQTPPPPPWAAPPRPAQAARPAAPAPVADAAPPIAPLALEPTEEVTCPNCGERQSKRLLCRNCTTNIEMAIAAKEEAQAEARAARQEARDSRHGRRTRTVAAADNSAGIFGLGFDGRMGRLKYATANIASLALFYVPLIMVLQRPTLGRLALLALAAIALTFFGMRLAVLRCHDCDKSGWWSMLLWLPTVNFIVTIVLACAPGTDGDNEYGEPPPPSSWLAFAAALLCFVLLIALTFSHLMRIVERAAEEQAEADEPDIVFQSDPLAATLPNLQAQAGFNESYLPAKGHKAFAVSPSGGWGWAGGRSSPNEAMRGALQECEARRPAYTGPCALVNVNGQWAPDR